MSEDKIGFVYLAETASMPGLVKIGMTFGDVQKRLTEIGVTGMLPYTSPYYCKVQNPAEVERRLHEVFDYCREVKNREFFRVDWRAVKASMQIIERMGGGVISETKKTNNIPQKFRNPSLLKRARKGPPKVRSAYADIIKNEVAKFYNLRVSDLTSAYRKQSIAYPRHIAMYLCRNMTNLSFPEIGDQFGAREHSTVLHSCRKVEEMLATNPQMREEVQFLENKLRQ